MIKIIFVGKTLTSIYIIRFFSISFSVSGAPETGPVATTSRYGLDNDITGPVATTSRYGLDNDITGPVATTSRYGLDNDTVHSCGSCEHGCKLAGTAYGNPYRCVCKDGYQLGSDGKSCEGMCFIVIGLSHT